MRLVRYVVYFPTADEVSSETSEMYTQLPALKTNN